MPSTDYPPFSPYICVRDAARAIEFYKQAFGANERYRLTDRKTGKVGHAEILIQNSLLMLAEENPEWGNKAPPTVGGSSVTFCVMVPDVDAAHARAVAAGANSVMAPADQFYGFRSCHVVDPFGHQWMLQKQIEVVPPDEMQRRWDAMTSA